MQKIAFVAVLVMVLFGTGNADDTSVRLAGGNAAFACDLYSRLSVEEGSLFFSPYSVFAALAMTLGGARGETATQMAQALHFSLPLDQVPSAFAQLQSAFDEAQGNNKITLGIANSIWPSLQFKMLDSYATLLKSNYGVELTPLDYSNPEVARNAINKWVESKTRDKIEDLIGPGALKPGTPLVLVNAIYFYGKWLKAFRSQDTHFDSFYTTPTVPEQVKMMSQRDRFPYAELPKLQLLELPYQGGDLSMLIVLPESKDGLKEIESSLTAAKLDEWKSKLVVTDVSVRLPKFKMTWGTKDLKDTLQALGMTDAFSAGADFSGMDGNTHGLFIAAVLHKAFIDVKEEGTEAAAATAVVMTRGLGPVTPLFTADHPFLFLIQEKKTGSILFVGRLSDPVAAGE